MTDVAGPAHASVIVLAVHELTRKAVAEQGRVRARIEDLVRAALQPVPPERCIVLDAPQGLVVAQLDSPGAALAFAERVQAGAADLPLCIGINHGPVTIAKDANRGQDAAGADAITRSSSTLRHVWGNPDRRWFAAAMVIAIVCAVLIAIL